MTLRHLQRLWTDDAGRFAPFMFGLLLAVSAFSMTMKSRVEAKLAQEKLVQQHRAEQSAHDLKEALEIDLLLESSYDNTLDLTRARRYLSRSSGYTGGSADPTLNNQTGDTLDNLTRQTTLIGVTDDSLLSAAITADSDATHFMNGFNNTPTAVFDAQATRQTQLKISKQNLDAFSAEALEFAKSQGRMPNTEELATIAATTGLGSFWSGAFSHTANLFNTISSFTAPWGADTYSNTATVPYPTTNPSYTWATAVETSQVITASSAGNNIVNVGAGVVTYTANTTTFVLERQGSTWAETTSLADQVIRDISDNIMLTHNTSTGDNNVLRRQNGSWEVIQTLTDPDGGTPTAFGDNTAQFVRVGDTLHLYIKDKSPSTVLHYFVSSSVDVPNFVFQATITPPVTCASPALALDSAVFDNTMTILPDPIAVLGCGDTSSSQGVAYVYQGTTLKQTLSPTTLEAGDNFGRSVSLQWPYLAIGAWVDEISGPDNGAVYIYQDIDPSLSQANFSLMSHFEETTLTAPTANSGKNTFGINVAFIDDRTLAVQARYTNTLGTGNDSDVIIYTLTDQGWTNVRQISKASSAGISEDFGGSLGGGSGIMAVSKKTDTTTPTLYIYTAPEF